LFLEGKGIEALLILVTELTSWVCKVCNIEQSANPWRDKLRSRSFREAVSPLAIQAKSEGTPALDPRMDIPPDENTVVQPRQRRDTQFHAASLDVPAESFDTAWA
jgi:hypothetical protein